MMVWRMSQILQLESSLKSYFLLGKWDEPHQPRPQNPRWLSRSSTVGENCRVDCLEALLSLTVSFSSKQKCALQNRWSARRSVTASASRRPTKAAYERCTGCCATSCSCNSDKHKHEPLFSIDALKLSTELRDKQLCSDRL